MRTINIEGQIGSWEADPQEIVSQINQDKGDILVNINSIGGSVIDGFTIYNAIKAYDKGEIIVEIGAVAASIASYIALAGDLITAKSNSVYMIHNAWLPAVGDFVELRKAADISEGLSSIIANAYVAKTGMGKSDALSLMENETFYYGNEIKEAGFVDDVLSVDDVKPKAEAYSMAMESIKACNRSIVEHSNDIDFEAVAKLLPKEAVETKEVVDLSAQQRRARELYILEQGVNL